MMKLNIRLIALILSLIMTVGMFAACNGTPEETTAEPEQSTEPPVESAEDTSENIEANVFNFIVNGEAAVKIIRPQDLTSSDPAVQAAIKIRNLIDDATGVKITMADDFKKASEQYDDSTVEILVGRTGHQQVTDAISDLPYGDYTIKAIGNKIVVFGYTEGALLKAANVFAQIIEEYMSKDGDVINVSVPAEVLNVTDTHSGSEELSSLPVYNGGIFTASYTSNTACEEIILEGATVDNYNAYIAKLEASGYTKYTDTDISGNLFTTLYNSDYTLNVGYYKPYEECRIIMEPFSELTLPALKADSTRPTVTTSQITMLGCEYVGGDGKNVGNGLSLLYRLSDGSFVIVDGGHTTQSATFANNLINAITEQAKDYATGKDIRIAAWFVSHAHGDHMGMLRKQASLFKSKFTVERVIANFMSDSEVARSLGSSYGDNFGGGEAGSDDYVRNAAAVMGADFIVCHVGQKYYFGDTVFEILYTIESYGPAVTNALNTTTILVRSITKDASGKETAVMVMGDITGPAMAICNKMYGADMRCQVVQVAHHGYGTWGNESAMATAYKFMSPEIVLWPQGLKAFPNYKEKSYSKVLWDGTNKNFQQLYVAGWSNTQHIVPLPYNGDVNTIVSKITVQP